MDDWWAAPMAALFGGRRVVLAGAVAAAWTEHVDVLRAAGASEMMIVATEGRGIGPVPDLPTIVVEPPSGSSMMERLHFGTRTLEHPPPEVVAALDRFDPDGGALVVGTFLNTAPALAGRAVLAHRRPEWVALEDKVVVDAFWDRAGIDRCRSAVVDLDAAPSVEADVDLGDGTVWAADARNGFHGGATKTHWVTDEASRRRAIERLAPVCDRVRVMPFLEGIPCSIHGIVLPDGVVTLRPIEMVTLRRGNEFVYAGCATFWDPPTTVRRQMRRIARLVGAQLADEVDFRGTFTVDGVATQDGFCPTELNPRFGAGINTVARASGLPVQLVNELVVAGVDLGRTCSELEAELVAAADGHRGGGTWTMQGVGAARQTEGDVRVDEHGEFLWADDPRTVIARVVSGNGFIRCTYRPGAVAIGPSTAPIAARFWAFADRELGAGLGSLSAAADLRPAGP